MTTQHLDTGTVYQLYCTSLIMIYEASFCLFGDEKEVMKDIIKQQGTADKLSLNHQFCGDVEMTWPSQECIALPKVHQSDLYSRFVSEACQMSMSAQVAWITDSWMEITNVIGYWTATFHGMWNSRALVVLFQFDI